MKQSLWSLAAAASFCIMAAFVKLCSDQLGAFELVFYRSLIGVILISVFVYRTGNTVRTHLWKLHLGRSFFGCLSIVLWFYTLARMDFGTNMTLIYTTPLFMAANFAVLALMRHTTPPWGLIVPTITGFIGVTVVLQPALKSDELIPALICLFVSLIDLIVYWQMKKMGDTKEPSWRIVFYFTLLCTVFAVAGTIGLEGGFHIPDTKSAIGIVGMSIFATLGQISSTRSYAYGNLLLSSLLGFSAIPFSLLTGVLLFDERVTWVSIAGVVLIIISGAFATINTKRAEKLEEKRRAAQNAG